MFIETPLNFEKVDLGFPLGQKLPPEAFWEKNVLKNFAKFAGKCMYWSLFFNKVRTLLKKRLEHSHFPVNFATILRIPLLQNISRRLFLLGIKQYGATLPNVQEIV